MSKECWRTIFSETHQKNYYVNMEIGKSQWGLPVNNLPPNWEEHMSMNIYPNTNYYFNKQTRISQWDHPNNYYNYKDKDLPPGWERKLSRTCKNVYYVNQEQKKSEWEIPTHVIPKKMLSFVIPDDKEIEIYGSVKKGKVLKPPRALKYEENSCYLDSALFAFFAGPKDFINKMLTEDIEKNIDNMIPMVCNRKREEDVKSRKLVQQELLKISKSIMRTGENVEYSTALRKSFETCPDSEKYHEGVPADSGEFMSYLLNMLSFEYSAIRIQRYGTNKLGIDLEKVIEEKNDPENPLYEFNTMEFLPPIHVISSDIIQSVGKSEVSISELLVHIMDRPVSDGLFYPEDSEGRIGMGYKRLIEIRTIEYTTYLIVSLRRVASYTNRKIIKNRVIPNLYIELGDQTFSLSAAVMHTGGCHYVAIAKYNDVWWYYDDQDYKYNKKLVPYDSFEQFIDEVENDPTSGKINPYTHGTQFYYNFLN